MTIFITGGSGLLGSKIAEIAISKGEEVFSGYCHHSPEFGEAVNFDLSRQDYIAETIKKMRPEVIYHTAALTDVDKCEIYRELAYKINVKGTELISKAANEIGAFLVYISTDYVFDGFKGYYKEDDPTNPLNYYGYTKLLGESCCDCIARTCVIYGSRPASGKVNFALWLIKKLKDREDIRIVTDQYITPTLNTNLAKMVLEMGERRFRGVWHTAGATRVSRYEFACELASTFGFNNSSLIPSNMSEMIWDAQRPADSSLDTFKATSMLHEKPYKMRQALIALKEEIEYYEVL